MSARAIFALSLLQELLYSSDSLIWGVFDRSSWASFSRSILQSYTLPHAVWLQIVSSDNKMNCTIFLITFFDITNHTTFTSRLHRCHVTCSRTGSCVRRIIDHLTRRILPTSRYFVSDRLSWYPCPASFSQTRFSFPGWYYDCVSKVGKSWLSA